jgi:hypothetical protein
VLEGNDEWGDPGDPYEPPETIMCDYIGGLSAKLGSIGKDRREKHLLHGLRAGR